MILPFYHNATFLTIPKSYPSLECLFGLSPVKVTGIGEGSFTHWAHQLIVV